MLQENSNKSIMLNTVILYARLVLISVCGLLTTRLALKALGATDYGLFAVVGGVISFIALINTIMLSCSNRFIATAIGKGEVEEIKNTFNVCFSIHVGIAIITAIIAIPLGDWYILNYVNFDGDINLAVKIFNITIVGSIISFLGVPFNGLLVAKERFWVFCSTDAVSAILKMVGAGILIYYFENKLMIYAIILTVLSAYPAFVFFRYCKKVFPEYTKFKFVRDKQLYKNIFSFSIWVGYGALASIGKSQGTAVIVNAFFNTLMNTAMGLANSVNSLLLTFSSNLTRSISPQITKTYASGNLERCEHLVVFASKISFMGMFAVALPFFLEPDWILGLWLGKVPAYTVYFVHLMLIDALIGSLNAGIPEVIFASGKIKVYQIIVNSIFLLSVLVGWFVLKLGYDAPTVFIVYIIFSVIVLVIRQIVLNKVVKFNNWRLIKDSYLPSFAIVLFSVPLAFVKITPFVNILIAFVWMLISIYIIGLEKDERIKVNQIVMSISNRLFHKD